MDINKEMNSQISSTLTSDKKIGRHKKRRNLIIILFLTISILVLLYGVGVYYFRSRFLPYTHINGMDYSYQNTEAVRNDLEDVLPNTYQLKLTDGKGNAKAVLTAKDMELLVSTNSQLDELKRKQNPYTWILQLFDNSYHACNVSYMVTYDKEMVADKLDQVGIFSEYTSTQAQNAYISEYDSETKRYEIIPEKEGMLLDTVLTLSTVYEAIEHLDVELDLREKGCYLQADVTADHPELQKKLTELNTMVGTQITYDWNGMEEILDGDTISTWIVEEDGQLILDEEKVNIYLNEKACSYDTYGKKRKFTTTSGIELTLPSGGYGWKTDKKAEREALLTLVREGAVMVREPEYLAQGYVKGQDDIGSSYVEIDLSNQYLYLYMNGEVILETAFVSGNMENGNATPAGVFGITYKTKNAVLRGETYETPVDYWMPFNGNVGMHDASWRRKFGETIYLTSGSHGCINLPPKKAAELYEHMEKRFPVICYYY